MKRALLFVSALFVTLCAIAQEYTTRYQSVSEPQTLLPVGYTRIKRYEVILPNVNGYTPYKADLHIHSTLSDGVVNIKGRMEEAWNDGLDIIAATDHLSIRPIADKVGQPTPESAKIKRGTKPTKAVESATNIADDFGLLVIPGVELTGEGAIHGHYNALFIKDINTVYDYDPIQNIRNARQQGALIMHNHPGWRHSTLEKTEFEKQVYAENLIDGIEVMNGLFFYPRSFETAKKHDLFITSNTDIHATTAQTYRENGMLRNMTIIFAKELSLNSIREGLEAHRTLAYSYGTIGGDESLLKDFFKAAIETKRLSENKKSKTQRVMLTNKSSFPYTLRIDNDNPIVVHPLSSTIVTIKKGKPLECTVINMWYGMNLHPTVELKY